MAGKAAHIAPACGCLASLRTMARRAGGPALTGSGFRAMLLPRDDNPVRRRDHQRGRGRPITATDPHPAVMNRLSASAKVAGSSRIAPRQRSW